METISTDKGDRGAVVSGKSGQDCIKWRSRAKCRLIGVAGRRSCAVWGRGKKRQGKGELCAEGGCEPPQARPLQGSVAERETRQVHPSHAHSLSHHYLDFLGRSDFISVLLLIAIMCRQALSSVHQWQFMHAFTVTEVGTGSEGICHDPE